MNCEVDKDCKNKATHEISLKDTNLGSIMKACKECAKPFETDTELTVKKIQENERLQTIPQEKPRRSYQSTL